jgi:hypothetical protein
MLLDPITNKIFTAQGQFLKKLFCPYKISWESLQPSNGSRLCSKCDKTILDTKELTDDELLKILMKNPNTCLKINLDQSNLKII